MWLRFHSRPRSRIPTLVYSDLKPPASWYYWSKGTLTLRKNYLAYCLVLREINEVITSIKRHDIYQSDLKTVTHNANTGYYCLLNTKPKLWWLIYMYLIVEWISRICDFYMILEIKMQITKKFWVLLQIIITHFIKLFSRGKNASMVLTSYLSLKYTAIIHQTKGIMAEKRKIQRYDDHWMRQWNASLSSPQGETLNNLQKWGRYWMLVLKPNNFQNKLLSVTCFLFV